MGTLKNIFRNKITYVYVFIFLISAGFLGATAQVFSSAPASITSKLSLNDGLIALAAPVQNPNTCVNLSGTGRNIGSNCNGTDGVSDTDKVNTGKGYYISVANPASVKSVINAKFDVKVVDETCNNPSNPSSCAGKSNVKVNITGQDKIGWSANEKFYGRIGCNTADGTILTSQKNFNTSGTTSANGTFTAGGTTDTLNCFNAPFTATVASCGDGYTADDKFAGVNANGTGKGSCITTVNPACTNNDQSTTPGKIVCKCKKLVTQTTPPPVANASCKTMVITSSPGTVSADNKATTITSNQPARICMRAFGVFNNVNSNHIDYVAYNNATAVSVYPLSASTGDNISQLSSNNLPVASRNNNGDYCFTYTPGSYTAAAYFYSNSGMVTDSASCRVKIDFVKVPQTTTPVNTTTPVTTTTPVITTVITTTTPVMTTTPAITTTVVTTTTPATTTPVVTTKPVVTTGVVLGKETRTLVDTGQGNIYLSVVFGFIVFIVLLVIRSIQLKSKALGITSGEYLVNVISIPDYIVNTAKHHPTAYKVATSALKKFINVDKQNLRHSTRDKDIEEMLKRNFKD